MLHEILFALLVSQTMFDTLPNQIGILPYEGSLMTLLIIAGIAIVVLAVFRFLIPVIVVGVIIIVLLILVFGGIPVPA